MKYVKFKNNRFCKIFIFLFILVFGFSILVYKSNNKVKAGVVIESQYYTIQNRGFSETTNGIELANNTYYYGITRAQFNAGWDGILMTNLYDSNNNLLCQIRLKQIAFSFQGVTVGTVNLSSYARNTLGLKAGNWSLSDLPLEIVDLGGQEQIYLVISLEKLFTGFRSQGDTIGANGQALDNNNLTLSCSTFSFGVGGSLFMKENVIASATNLYDMQQNSICILYLEDISGLNTSDFMEEITIHWGYIDDDNNSIFASYSPTIDIFNDTTNNVIKLSLPQNASGSASTFKEISQNASFSLGDLYESTTTANIYAIYIYLQSDAIYWGYLNFDVPQTPAVPSAQSMQYITGSEQVYTFNYANTSNMACRLSISNNVNYITILNQSTFNISNINTVFRQGGFFPAWSLYNWSRGARLGYQAGYDAGEAPFREGNVGYQAIFDAGYRAGQDDSIDTTFLVSLFDSVDAFFNIHLFPLITIGEIIGIPFIISVVWFIIRQLRGGGGND